MRTPRRIQLSRAKGWRKPQNAIVVARPTRWGNPFVVGTHGTRAEVVGAHARLLQGFIATSDGPATDMQRQYAYYVKDNIGALRDHDLACWCSLDGPCHADLLLALANQHDLDGTLARALYRAGDPPHGYTCPALSLLPFRPAFVTRR